MPAPISFWGDAARGSQDPRRGVVSITTSTAPEHPRTSWPLLTRALGTLPAADRNRRGRDLGKGPGVQGGNGLPRARVPRLLRQVDREHDHCGLAGLLRRHPGTPRRADGPADTRESRAAAVARSDRARSLAVDIFVPEAPESCSGVRRDRVIPPTNTRKPNPCCALGWAGWRRQSGRRSGGREGV